MTVAGSTHQHRLGQLELHPAFADAPCRHEPAHAIDEPRIVQVARGKVDCEWLLELRLRASDAARRNAASSTHCVSGVIRPLLSANSTKIAGETIPCRGCFQRISASAPQNRRVLMSTFGWQYSSSSSASIARRRSSIRREAMPALVVVHAAVQREVAVRTGAIHRDLRAAHQLVGIVAVVRVQRDAHGTARIDLRSRELDWPVKRIDDAPRDVRCVRGIGIAQQHDELVLADARERVLAAAGDGRDAPGDLGHQPIARRMPKRVADLVEMPDVHRQDRERALAFACALRRPSRSASRIAARLGRPVSGSWNAIRSIVRSASSCRFRMRRCAMP